VSECRNCGSGEVQDLGLIGQVQPFFLKRVFGIELRTPRSPNAMKQKIRDLVAIPISSLSRVTGQFAYVEMQLCRHCFFVQTSIPFHDEDIMRLYADYRSPVYTAERTSYEPEYAMIAPAIGQVEQEVNTRRSALAAFLSKVLNTSHTDNILDYGGADGRFIPNIPGSKFVFEISTMDPIAGVTRVKSEADLGTYSLILFAHVTEHVTQPLQLVRKLSAYVKPGGYLYIETPQEISDQQRLQLQNGARPFDLGIHEHINYYCVQAVRCLLEAAGFSIAAIESGPVDVGWAKSVHIRALGQKPASS
jgi:hypothetical protein